MIDARPRLEQHAHRRLLLDVGERGRVVVDAELGQRAVEGNLALGHRDADQRAEQALAHRRELGPLGRVAPFRHHGAAMDHHEGGRVDLLRPRLHVGQQGFGPPGLRRRHVVPGGAWKPVLRRGEAAQQQRREDRNQQQAPHVGSPSHRELRRTAGYHLRRPPGMTPSAPKCYSSARHHEERIAYRAKKTGHRRDHCRAGSACPLSSWPVGGRCRVAGDNPGASWRSPRSCPTGFSPC